MTDNRPNLLALLADLDATPRGTFDVRITVAGRVLDIDSRYVKAHDALTSALILGNGRAKAAMSARKPVSASVASVDYEPPAMTFIPEETPIPGTSTPEPQPVFDMGKAEEKPERKVLGEEEAETLELPSWLEHASGNLRPHRETAEGWE